MKPANLLLDRDRVLHVADFGIAQLGSDDTLTVAREVLGTAAYLAPERALGRPATEATDLYALGVVAFELLVGERPFSAELLAAQARQHIEDSPPRPAQLNPALPLGPRCRLARGMAKRPRIAIPPRSPSPTPYRGGAGPGFAPRSDRADAVSRGRRAAAARRAPSPRRSRSGSSPGGRLARARFRHRAARRRRPRCDARAAPVPRRRPAIPVSAAARPRQRRPRAIASGASPAPAGRPPASLAAVVIGVIGSCRAAHPAAAHHRAEPRPVVTHHAPAPTPARRGPRPSRRAPRGRGSAAPPAPPSADALESQGHALMYGGQYARPSPCCGARSPRPLRQPHLRLRACSTSATR